MSQMNFTEHAGNVDAGAGGARGTDQKGSAAIGARPARRSVVERVRAEAEAAARSRFPAATHIACNPHHQGGPVVEVRCENWPHTRSFRFTGYEL